MVLVGICYSCSDYDSFSNNPSFRIAFSSDTVKFDTLISTIPSPTKTLYVYNNNSDGLRVSNVRLKEGLNSHFRVNVDGEYLLDGSGTDYLIRKNDSIIVRIEVTLPECGSTDTVSYTDELQFSLENGCTQRVVLTAGALDAYIIHGMTIDDEVTLKTDKPYLIYDSLVVRKDGVLNLLPGTRLLMHDSVSVDVYGKIDAQGTIAAPVIFRGARTDHMFDYLYYDNTPNRWKGIVIHQGSFNNTFTNCDIHSGRWGIVVDSTSVDDYALSMHNCIVHNIGGDGLQLHSCKANISNCQISNTKGTCVAVYGGAYDFTFCTIAQFYPLSADRGDALYVANKFVPTDGHDIYRDLKYIRLNNCVITGYADDVIMGGIYTNTEEDFNYLFHNCFLRTIDEADEDHYEDCIYDNKEQELEREKNFTLFDTYNFIYDFTPDSLSSIRNMADKEYLKGCEFDRIGRSRLTDEGPDVGCYEYLMQEKR